jgi:N6-adenosine-specific RNA methylase IME4
MRAWGFQLKTTLVWDKVTAGGRPAFGAGHYYRGAHELVLFGVRGRCAALSRSERTRFEGQVGRHSQKPELLQDMADRVSPGPRLELFARRRRPGWTCWGNQLPAEPGATGTEG